MSNTPQPGRPLSAEDVALLKGGDVLRWNGEVVEVVRVIGTVDVGLSNGDVVARVPATDLEFIGRPDAYGWMKGEPPTGMVDVEVRYDQTVSGHDRIIAFRLSRSASACPKCGFFSGDDWKQCGGACPQPMSPHYALSSAPASGGVKLDVLASMRDHYEFALKGPWPGITVPHYALAGLFKMAGDEIERLRAQPARQEALGHVTRASDSSIYDEVCVRCGATDAASDVRLNAPCPAEDGALREVVARIERWIANGMPDTSDHTPHRDRLKQDLQAVLALAASPPGAGEPGFLGHLVSREGVTSVFVPKGEHLHITASCSVQPVYDGPQNVTASPSAQPAEDGALREAAERLEARIQARLIERFGPTGLDYEPDDQDCDIRLLIQALAAARPQHDEAAKDV